MARRLEFLDRFVWPFVGICSGLSLFDQYVLSVRPTTGPSMYPTIPLFSFIVFTPNPSSFGKNDIVSCINPINEGAVVKRITAVAGDTVTLDTGTILIPRGHVCSFPSNPQDLARRRRRPKPFPRFTHVRPSIP
jgi:signal peptidase I